MYDKSCCCKCGTHLHEDDVFFGCPNCDEVNPKSKIGAGYQAVLKRIPCGDVRTFQQFFEDMMREDKVLISAGT